MSTVDFSLAKTKHLLWKTRLRDFLAGKASLTEAQAVSHTECDLGRWLYGGGLAKYAAVREMQALERAHVDLHAAVKRVVQLKHAGNRAAAEAELARVERLSGEIVALLDQLEHIAA